MDKKREAEQEGMIACQKGKDINDNPFVLVSHFFEGEAKLLADSLGEFWKEGFMWENVNGED